MQASYPKQDTDANEVSKSGTNVHECRKSIISDAVERLRVAYRYLSRTKRAQSNVTNAPDWYAVVTPQTSVELFAQAHAIEGRQPKRAEFEVLDFLAHRLENLGIGDRRDRHVILQNVLRLLI